MTSAYNVGRFKVMGEQWVTTTVSVHRTLRKLPPLGEGTISRVELVQDLGSALTQVALELLDRKGWARPVDKSREHWVRTDSGVEHLHAIEHQEAQISLSLEKWLIEGGLDKDRAGSAAGVIAEEAQAALWETFMGAVGRGIPELLRAMAASERAKKVPLLAQALDQAVKDIEQRRKCALVSILCREALEIVLKRLYEAVPVGEKEPALPYSIILDTNVFIRLVCKSASQHEEFKNALNKLASRRALMLYVTSRTMEEVVAVLKAGEAHIHALVAARPGLDSAAAAEAGTGNPFVLEYAGRFGGDISYRLFADREKMRLWGLFASDPTSSGIRSLVGPPCNISLLRAEARTGLELSGIPTRSYGLSEWPTFRQTERWMRARKLGFPAQHDAILSHMAIRRRQEDTTATWVVWTEDNWLLMFESTFLNLADPTARLFRDLRMMQALCGESPPIDKVVEETMLALTSWAAADPHALQRLKAALELLQGAAPQSYEAGLDLLERTFSDPYGALDLFRPQEAEEALQEAMEEPWTAVQPVTTPALREAVRRAPTAWPPEIVDSGVPPIRRLKDGDRRLNELVLLSGPGRYLELSSDWASYAAAHGPLPITVGKRILVGTRLYDQAQYPQLHISVHAVAHFDLPWAVVQIPEELKPLDARPDRDSAPAKAMHHRIIRPQEREAVIVDLRYKSSALHEMIDEVPARSGEWVLSSKGMRNVGAILRNLWISKEELQHCLLSSEGPISLDGRWVVFHTGWPDLFRPTWPEISNPGFECWHCWTLHPYVDEECVNWLVEQGVYGIATDTAMIDCPAYVMPKVAHVLGPLAGARQFIVESYPSRGDGPVLPPYQPAHVGLLLRNHPMLESVSIPWDILSEAAPGYVKHGTLVGSLFTAGLGMPQMMDSALAKVFLRLPDVT